MTMDTGTRHYSLSEVYNEAKQPSVTYVSPREERQLKGSLATEGKHITLVGPSGSGKSTLANRALDAVGFKANEVHSLSGRSYTNASSILEVFSAEFDIEPEMDQAIEWLSIFKLILIDDVHHLSASARDELAKSLKLWHENGIRFFLIGIAKTGEALLGSDPELAIRNDVWHLSSQTDEFLQSILTQGEKALNISFTNEGKDVAIRAAQGSPSLFQAICRVACIEADILETQASQKEVNVDLPLIRDAVVRQYDGRYLTKIVSLARGRRQARSVHDTFYRIVEHIAKSKKLEISKDELYHKIVGSDDASKKSRIRNSFYRSMNTLAAVIEEHGLSDILIYDNGTLTIDDPVFRFYLDHLDFSRVKAQVNVRRLGYEYDVAVSFAGEDRPTVETLVRALTNAGLEVFYDFDEQAMLWGKNLRAELGRVYGEDAQFMIVCLSDDYPEKDWTNFEFEIGKAAAGKRTEDYLLPLVIGANKPSIIGLPSTVGHLTLKDRTADEVADLVVQKIHSTPSSRASTSEHNR